MEQQKQEIVELELKELLFVILRKWWLIALVTILGAVLAGAYTIKLVTPIYTSTSKVYVINREYENITTWSDLQSGTYIAQDLMIVVKSRPIMEEVIRRLQLDLTAEELINMISVYTPTDTRILEITVAHYDPQMAKLLVDTVAQVSSEQMVEVMQLEKVNVVEEGNVPIAPSSPSLIRNVILGGFMGAVIVIGIIVTMNLLNDSIKSSDEIEKYLGITTLGIIPLQETNSKKDRKNKRSKYKRSKYKDKEAMAS